MSEPARAGSVTDPSTSRPGRTIIVGGLVLATVVAAALALWPPSQASAIETPADLEAWILEHPDQASFLVLDGETEVAAHAEDRSRAVAGLPALLLAVEYARQVEVGLDTTYQVPASVLERQRLPVVEAREPDLGPLTLPALVRAAVRGHRPASDELLRILGRSNVEALPERLGVGELDAPLPIGGLVLAWAPASWVRGTAPAEQTARFSRISRPSQRDSAFARSRAFQSSAAYRAEETSRLQATGLGLTEAETHAAAQASFPRATARAYAGILARAVSGTLLSPSVSDRVLRSLRASSPDPTGAVVHTMGGAAVGLVGAAAVSGTRDQPRVAVLLLEGFPVEIGNEHARLAEALLARWAASPATAGGLGLR